MTARRTEAIPRNRRPTINYQPLSNGRAITIRWIWLVPS
jgi:hypothetical protein